MAHFAKIDNLGIVVAVETGSDSSEELNLCSESGNTYRKTSYNTIGGTHSLGGTPFRKNFAGVSGHYDAGRDAFYGPPDYPSWVLDESTCQWEAPYPCPDVDDTGNMYFWDEDAYQADNSTGWVEIEA